MSRRPSPLDNEQCRQCSSFSDYVKKTKKKIKEDTQDSTKTGIIESDDLKKKREDCPLDKDEVGRAAWSFLHTMAARYPEKPTTEQKGQLVSFFKSFAEFYPCSVCRDDFKEELKIDPPKAENQEALSQWLCRMHNKVNIKLGKEVFDCSKVNERWRDGWLDGSCDW